MRISIEVTDHLGVSFNNIQEMCGYHGIAKSKYYSRKRNGWSLEEILTDKRMSSMSDIILYSEDQIYDALVELCHYKDLNASILNQYYGLLSKDVKKHICRDHEGNVFKSIYNMCEYWEVSV